MRKKHIIFAAVLLCLALGICFLRFFGAATQRQFSAKQSGSLLVDDIHSYETMESVSSRLTQRGIAYYAPAAEGSDRCSIRELVVRGYTHLGEEGQLKLSFFNDRLMQASFQPKDKAAYVKQLSRTPITLASHIQQRENIYSIIWEDTRLGGEYVACVALYH
jgi:hypothetical protein